VDWKKIACGLRGAAFFQTSVSFPAAKSVVFAACLHA
jgi:hypothetical protein